MKKSTTLILLTAFRAAAWMLLSQNVRTNSLLQHFSGRHRFMAFQGVVRYVCWPWYDCGCPVGKLVSESVMRRHLKIANERRAELGRGAFKAGPKVTDSSVTEYRFDFLESLEDHDTEDEDACLTDVQIEYLMDTPHQSDSNFIANEAPVHSYQDFKGNDDQCIEPNHYATNDPSNDDELAIAEADLYYSAFTAPDDQINPLVADPHTVHQDLGETGASSNVSGLSEGERTVLSALDGEYTTQQNLIDTSSFVEEDGDVASDGSLLLEGDYHDEGELISYVDDFEFSRIPHLLPWVLENKTWVDLYIEHGLEFTVMDDILARIGAPCKKWITVMNCIARSTSIIESFVTVPNCPGHMCYANLIRTDPILQCTECAREKPELGEPSCNVVTYLPILPRMAAIVRNERGFESLYGYRHSYSTETGLRRDYFDSVAFQRLCQEHGGEENLRYDIFLSVSTDGFQAHKNKAYDVWPVAAVIFNLPPEQRTCVKTVMPLMFIREGKEPKDLQSYLIPFVNELLEMAENGGALLRFFDGTDRLVRVHLIHFTGDSPAIAKVASLKGHHCKCPADIV